MPGLISMAQRHGSSASCGLGAMCAASVVSTSPCAFLTDLSFAYTLHDYVTWAVYAIPDMKRTLRAYSCVALISTQNFARSELYLVCD